MKCIVNILVTKMEIKKRQKSDDKYIMVTILDLESGEIFDIVETDIEVLSKVKAMTKHIGAVVSFKNSQYGIKPYILDYGKQEEL